MKNLFQGLSLIESTSQGLLRVPSIHRRRSRGIKLSLISELRTAKYYRENYQKRIVKEWLEEELMRTDARFYIKILNSFFYLPIHLIPSDNRKVYMPLKTKLERIFEMQDEELSLRKSALERNKDVAIVYADTIGTVASASISSLYCAARILIYRQIFFSIMTNWLCAYTEIPIGDSLFTLFEEPKNALAACVDILPYVMKNRLKVTIGMTYGKDFLSDSQGRPIIGRDTNLVVRLADKMGRLFENTRIIVSDGYDEHKNYSLDRKNVNIGLWIADAEDRSTFNLLFNQRVLERKIRNNGLKLVKYTLHDQNVKRELNKLWRKIGYGKGTIYGIVPGGYLVEIR